MQTVPRAAAYMMHIEGGMSGWKEGCREVWQGRWKSVGLVEGRDGIYERGSYVCSTGWTEGRLIESITLEKKRWCRQWWKDRKVDGQINTYGEMNKWTIERLMDEWMDRWLWEVWRSVCNGWKEGEVGLTGQLNEMKTKEEGWWENRWREEWWMDKCKEKA